MKIKYKLLFLAFAFTLTSCWKSENLELELEKPVVNPNESLTDTDDESFDFEIPDNFEWDNFQTINSKVSIYNRYDSAVEYGVEIYDGEDLIDAGITKNGVYTSSFVAKKGMNSLSVVQKDPSGATARVNVALDGSNLSYDFNSFVSKTTETRSVEFPNEITYPAPAAPTIPADAIEVVEGMEFVENGVYYIDACTVINNVKLDKVSGVQIYIAGEYNIPQASWFAGEKENFSIYVLEGGKLTASGELYADKYKNLKIVNYGEFITKGNGSKIHINGSILNAGKLSIGEGSAELLLLDNTTFENYGDFTSGRLGLSKGTVLKNYGEVEITGDVWTQSEAFELFENRNDFVAKGQIQLTGGKKVDNYHRIESETRVNIHRIGEVVLNPYSMIKAEYMDFQGSKFISNGDAIIKVVKHLSVDYSTTFVGNDTKPSVIYAPYENPYLWFSNTANTTGKWIIDPDPKIWAAKWNKDVVLGNSGYVINAVPSNDGGYNSEKVDEIPDSLEDIDFATTPKIVIFEDLYPQMGDSDFNDIVMQWNLRGVKDAKDIVKELYLDVTVKCCGAGRKVGAGVRIHSLTSNIAKATIESDDLSKHNFDEYFTPSNGVEADVNGVVVPLFESIHSLFGLPFGQFINVRDNGIKGDHYKFSVKLEFDNDITSRNIKLDNFDFFIVNSVNDEGRAEIHTFGNDVSISANNEISFKNPSAVWGIELPKEFLYLIERNEITLAYPSFKAWVESAGESNLDWYDYPEKAFVFENNLKAN